MNDLPAATVRCTDAPLIARETELYLDGVKVPGLRSIVAQYNEVTGTYQITLVIDVASLQTEEKPT